MKFATPGELYEHTYPFVRTELERLQSLKLLKPDSIPSIFRNTNRGTGEQGPSIDEVTERISVHIGDIFFANRDINIDILASNTAFWVQHLLKNPGRHLRMFDPHAKENKVVPVRPNTHIPIKKLSVNASYLAADLADRFPFFRRFFSHAKLDAKLWKRYVENLDEIGKQFEIFRERIERGEKNIFVVTNHMTWANIPLLAFCFHFFLGIPKERLYAMVGPAIFTSEFEFEGARRWMNLILTWPDTEKGDTGYGQADRVQKSALKNTLRIMRDVSDEVRVIFLAPSGTSDKMEDGKCMMAYPSQGTLGLMGSIGSNYPIFPIGVNDSEIMDSQGVPKKGGVRLRIGEPIEPPLADSIVIAKLPGLVIDRNGRCIGQWYFPKGTTNPALDYGNDT